LRHERVVAKYRLAIEQAEGRLATMDRRSSKPPRATALPRPRRVATVLPRLDKIIAMVFVAERHGIERLTGRYRRLIARAKTPSKVVIAIARELVGFPGRPPACLRVRIAFGAGSQNRVMLRVAGTGRTGDGS
jgi:hypothetical protein